MAAKSITRKFQRYLVVTVATLLLLMVAVLLLFRFVNPPTSAFMVGYALSHPDRSLQHRWVDLDDMSPWVPLAVIASEDQRFPDHWGVDFVAIRQAVADYWSGDSLRGASTITQQTAKNLFLWNGRNFVRKALDAGLALALEATWPKRRVLEVYLNIAEFGPGIYGVEAASRAYFGISARQLSSQQAARLAAVLPNPTLLNAARPSPYVQDRVAWIQGQMRQLSGLHYLTRI